MREGWKTIPFEQSIEKVKYTSKIASSEYLEEGTYPIISQEEGLISGYWNNDEGVFRLSKPVVIFGDHTRALKYVDFDFVLGADGVRILQPIEQIDTKFFLYYLLFCKIPSLGYSRHYKLLKELNIPIPPLSEQERIVAELDCLSYIIGKQKEQLKELDNLAQSIFHSMFGNPIINEKGWEVKKLVDVCEELFAGGDKPKDSSKIKTELYQYPIYANGDRDRGLLGYSKTYRVKKPAVTLGARGASVGNCRICKGYFTPVVRLITMVPRDIIDITYLYYSIRMLKFNVSGAGQAQLTIPNVINKEIPLPTLSFQQEFASKIEAIEKQKELIKQSIAETETLFNSRMDYYFN